MTRTTGARRLPITIAGLLLAVGGCSDVTTPSRDAPASTPPDYFGTTDFIGETVTVRGTVTRVITESGFELDTREYGDDSLLVLCAPSRDVTTGDRVVVSGNVQLFDYDSYAGQYLLDRGPTAYAEFAGERFLVSRAAMGLA